MLRIQKGFTLVELLVALFIFSLLSAFSYRAVNQLVNSRHMLSSELEVLSKVQKTFLFWEHDVQQSLRGGSDVKVTGSESLPTSDELAGFSLQTAVGRMHYVLRDDILYREHRVLSASENTEQQVGSLVLLSGVQSLSVNPILKSAIGDSSLYDGVEFSIQSSIFKQIRRVNFVGLQDSAGTDFSTLELASDTGSGNSTGVAVGNSTEVEIPANY